MRRVPAHKRFLEVAGREGAEALVFMLGWGGAVPVFADGRPSPAFVVWSGEDLWRRAVALEQAAGADLELGLAGEGGFVFTAPVLWAWTTGKDQLWRASRFTPAPSVVIRLGWGSERLMIWPLEKEESAGEVERHNDRLAYVLRGARARTKPERLRVPLPGTFLRVGRARPAPVLFTRLDTRSFASAAQVTRGLKDAPSRDAWRQRSPG